MSNKASALIQEAISRQSSTLDIGDCQLKRLPIELFKLKHLKQLDLSYNPLTTLKGIEQLEELETLVLSRTKIKSIAALRALKHLKRLGLRHTAIKNLTPLKDLKQLEYLGLQFTAVEDLSPVLPLIEAGIEVSRESQSRGIIIENCALVSPPMEIAEQGNKKILNYFRQVAEQGTDEALYEAKLIIVGEPGAGKTTLMKKLSNPRYKLQREDPTLGINIAPWVFDHPDDPKIQFQANLWDFGGQEIQYMTHQFFLTPSALYVLVHDNRAQKTNFPYWFEIIHLLGKEGGEYSPIIVILNDKSNKSLISNFDEEVYKKQYPETTIVPVSVNLGKANDAYYQMRTLIKKSLVELKHVGRELPKSWGPIRQELLKLKDSNYINATYFTEICERYDLFKEEDQEVLSSYLHQLGNILHFQQDPSLQDFIILNPQWAVEAVYKVITNKNVKEKSGRFSHNDLKVLWSDYSTTERMKLLNLMKKNNFEVCYEVADHQYIIPSLLSKISPQHPWNPQNKAILKFQFYYNFKPKGIITRLIVRLNEYIDQHQQKKLVWRWGVVLKKNQCTIRVVENVTEKEGTIDIEVIGHEKEKKFALRHIREKIEEIHRTWFPSISYQEKIPCYCEGCAASGQPYLFDYEGLLKFEAKFEAAKIPGIIYCMKHQNPVSIRMLLEGIYNHEEISRKKSSLLIFDSEDVADLKSEFKKSNEKLQSIQQSIDFNGHLLFKLLKANASQIQEIQELHQAIDQSQIAESELTKLNTYVLDILRLLQEQIDADSSLSQNVQQVIEDALRMDVKQKAKLIIGVPFIDFLKYETEVSWDMMKWFKALQEDIRRGKREGWKKAFINDPTQS